MTNKEILITVCVIVILVWIILYIWIGLLRCQSIRYWYELYKFEQSLEIGREYECQYPIRSDNPFDKPTTFTAKILDVRKNRNEKTWVKYSRSTCRYIAEHTDTVEYLFHLVKEREKWNKTTNN